MLTGKLTRKLTGKARSNHRIQNCPSNPVLTSVRAADMKIDINRETQTAKIRE